jgi:hypothetical protein
LNSLKENKSITVSQLCHDFVESMAQKTLDTCIKLYGKHDDIDEFIQFVLKEIKIKIANSDLLDIEKDYWNHQRIEQSFLSLIVKTYRKTMK